MPVFTAPNAMLHQREDAVCYTAVSHPLRNKLMSTRDVVVIGASAGGLEPLISIVGGLPQALPAALLVVVHTGTNGGSILPQILSRRTQWPVTTAVDGDPLEHGRVYVAPPDFHLMFGANGRLSVVHGPRENGFRPAIDPLFRSAARAFGPRVIGVVLSGALDDGAYGLGVVKRLGGVAVVQQPEDALVPSMPLNAIGAAEVDHVAPSADIAPLILQLVGSTGRIQKGEEERPMGSSEPEAQKAGREIPIVEMMQHAGPPSGLTCPDCGGALWELDEGRLVRYRCHVGHQFSGETLGAEQISAVEGALWSAVRILEEHADLRTRLSKRAQDAGLAEVARGFADRARESHVQALQLRRVLFGRAPDAADVAADSPPATPTRPSRGGRSSRR
jgi:two-component system chemotaxis response regulator CheB